ncbi:hypothetical protein [Yersinia wautersii]|uniref:hypothetical protein n=1 Tax=Yersinia wautersii TaxID=1341643 RepID=UPI0005399BA0|nr:hypothetical protein [Yersinia wautersii]
MVFSSDFRGYVLHLMWINNLLRQLNACENLCDIFGGIVVNCLQLSIAYSCQLPTAVNRLLVSPSSGQGAAGEKEVSDKERFNL